MKTNLYSHFKINDLIDSDHSKTGISCIKWQADLQGNCSCQKEHTE